MVFSKRTLGMSLGVIVALALIDFIILKKPAAGPREEEGTETAAGVPTAHEGSARPAAELPVAVKVAEVKKGDLVIRLRSPGEAVTDRRIVMKTEVAGVLRELKAREGLHVRAGDLLVRLDDERYRLALERMAASRLKLLSDMLLEKPSGRLTLPAGAASETAAKARQDLAAAEDGLRRGLVSPAEFGKISKECELILIEAGLKKEEVRAASRGLTQAEIDVKTAELDLGKTKIAAPFAGIITDIKVSPGERLEPGRDLFTLVNIGEIRVLARVLESEVGQMRVGRGVDLRFSAYPDKVFRGAVAAVSPVVNPEDKTCAVHVVVENLNEEIKPGMHAELEIAAEVYKDRILVPQTAVLVRGGRKLVFVVEEGLARWRYVEVGLENESVAEVLDGVREGETVIVEGHFALAHDAPVSLI